MSNELVVLCTCSGADEAASLANLVVEARLAACVNILPSLQSVYRWEGKVESATESLLLIKTTEARFEALRERLLAAHSYDTPEVIAIPISGGSERYLAWIRASV